MVALFSLCVRLEHRELAAHQSIALFLDVEPVVRLQCGDLAAVEQWALSGFIPTGWHLRLFGRVAAMRKTISPTVFGFDETDEEARALSRLMLGGVHV